MRDRIVLKCCRDNQNSVASGKRDALDQSSQWGKNETDVTRTLQTERGIDLEQMGHSKPTRQRDSGQVQEAVALIDCIRMPRPPDIASLTVEGNVIGQLAGFAHGAIFPAERIPEGTLHHSWELARLGDVNRRLHLVVSMPVGRDDANVVAACFQRGHRFTYMDGRALVTTDGYAEVGAEIRDLHAASSEADRKSVV